ncbi:MAG: hypothetical protein AAFN09_04110 [Pseudomonadota bacterium]
MFTIPSLAGLCAGAITGAIMAARRRGNGADMLQYGVAFGLIGFVIGIIFSLVLPPPS